jgi:hypothetical protein
MNVNSLTEMMSKCNINNYQESYVFKIINTINDSAQLGINSITYEISTLDNISVQNICNEIKYIFPDIDITFSDKHIYIDWS